LFSISETKKDSQVLADKIKVAEENLAGNLVNYWKISFLIYIHMVGFSVSLDNLKMTKNELIETKIIVEELSAKLNGI
jgi:hypothetical protein